MYNTSNSIDVLSFDEVKFDVKSDLFERIKKTSNKIRSNVFSVIDVFYVFLEGWLLKSGVNMRSATDEIL